jgi:hypothetical protein
VLVAVELVVVDVLAVVDVVVDGLVVEDQDLERYEIPVSG